MDRVLTFPLRAPHVLIPNRACLLQMGHTILCEEFAFRFNSGRVIRATQLCGTINENIVFVRGSAKLH